MATLKLVGKVWYSDLRLNGIRVQRALSSDRRIAQTLLDDMTALRRSQRYGETPKHVSWNFFKSRYKEFSAVNKVPQTVYRDELAFRMMEESIPIVRLDQITTELLERLKYKWQKDGKTLSVVTRAIKSLKTAMRVAEGWKYVAPQPWHSVKVKEPKGKLLFYSVDELNALLKVCHGSWLTAVLLMSRAGLRRGEAYHLDWSDVNLEWGSIWIRAKEGWSPKGDKERRIPIDSHLREHLKSLPERQGCVLGPDRSTLQSFDTYIRRLISKAKLKGSSHTLRHTFASHLVTQGASLKEIAELMGHGSTKMTEIYAHLAPGATQNAIKKLPELTSGLHPVPAELSQLRVI